MHGTGVYLRLPSRVQTSMTTASLSEIGGCWKSCYDTAFTSILFTNNVETGCTGDWVFAATYDPKFPSKFIVGAFARKGVFTRSFFKNICPRPPNDNTIATYSENEVYWYSGFCDAGGTLMYTFGFSSNSPVPLSYNNARYTNCPSPPTVDSTSWGYDAGCAGNKFSTVNSTASTTEYRRAMYTNTCDILLPPY